MARIAFMTIGVLKQPMGHPEIQGFIDRLSAVFGSADGSPGFIARSGRDSLDAESESWGEFVVPDFFRSIENPGQVPATLSLWEDLESVIAYAYRGAHGEAMGKRTEWFKTDTGPGYVAWWVEHDHIPTFAEASLRWANLHQLGPTPFAFDFKKPFAANGEPYDLARDRIRALSLLIP